MTFYLHIAHSLDRQLRKLSASCKKSEYAVHKCEQLLQDIRDFGVHHEKISSKRTKKGEARIRNCVKYDMGAGFRLVTVMNDNHLFVTFLGSHDDTDQWFVRHKADDFIPENPYYGCEEISVEEGGDGTELRGDSHLDEVDDYEKQLEERLDESILLSVFQGLNRNRLVENESL